MRSVAGAGAAFTSIDCHSTITARDIDPQDESWLDAKPAASASRWKTVRQWHRCRQRTHRVSPETG